MDGAVVTKLKALNPAEPGDFHLTVTSSLGPGYIASRQGSPVIVLPLH